MYTYLLFEKSKAFKKKNRDMTFAYQCAQISMATQYSMSVPTKYLELIACGPNNNGSHE